MAKTYTIEQLREAWLEASVAEWKRGIRDDDGGIPGDRDVITGYFNACRWGWHIGAGGYVEQPDNPWCGIGLGAMGLRIGHHLEPGICVPLTLDPDIAYWTLPSTRRMVRPRKWAASGSPMPRQWSLRGRVFVDLSRGTARRPEELLVPGAVATVCTRHYGDERDEVGGHFVMVRSYDPLGQLVRTVEFNGRGRRGDGTNGEGVVQVERPLHVFRMVHEFTTEHFERMER